MAAPMADLVAALREQFRPMHRGIALALWFHAALLLLALVALPMDHRTILGLDPWIKPIKFDLSTLIYAATMGLLLSHLARAAGVAAGSGAPSLWPRTVSRIGWAIAVSMIVENTLISLQSARGVRSHMNYTSWFNGISFAVMGVFIVVNTVALAVLLVQYLRRQTQMQWPPAVVTGARLGLALLLIGSVEGVAMVANAGHTVGSPDGAAGLPLVNWSTAHGDLRVPHFFALHALQLFLILGWLLSRTRARRAAQTAGMVAFAAIYLAGCGWLFHAAMHGQPLLGL